ncbi:cellulose synthase subunit BcsC-related outer membrane protein [Sphaerotilus mobilis]|uniref:Tetratricopeptide repeat protein n=1 Tax=Sphaerotilus mobilis TaxID=47994 RepID=A0A4Q7LU37_9BURK|nr:cellulose synthase subunit BcsC-related outer membrane protein [Sphaerotilus mobilis]RZS57833.1 tetratricopeptide repeat protein [Sphaerotilus mobilis]
MRRLSGLLLALASSLALPGVAAPAPPPSSDPARRSLDALIDSAQLWQARKRPDLARSVLQKVLAVQADEPRALLMMGELDLRAGRRNAALAELTQLQARHPDSPELRQLQQLAQLHNTDLLRLNRLQQLRELGKLDEASKLARQMFPTGEAPGLLGAEMAGLIAATPGGWEISRRQVERRVDRSGTALDRLALAEVLALSPATRKQAWVRLHALVAEGVLPREVIAGAWRRAIRLQPDDVAVGPLWDDYRRALGDDAGPNSNGRAAVAGAATTAPAAAPPAASLATPPAARSVAPPSTPTGPAVAARARTPSPTAAPRAEAAKAAAVAARAAAAKPTAPAASTAPAAADPTPTAAELAMASVRETADRLLQQGTASADAEAAALLAAALVQHGDDARAWGYYGIARLRQGDHAAAVPAFDRALAGDPSDTDRWRSLALTARYWAGVTEARRAADAGDDVSVIALLEALIETQPDAIEGPLLLAGARARQGDEAAARRLYERVLVRAPSEARAWRGLTALAMRQDPEAALAMLAQRYGIDTSAAAGNGTPPRSDADAPTALTTATPLAIDPADAVDVAAVRRVADQRRAEGRHGAALRLLEQALALAPSDTWLRYDTARVYADFRLPGLALAVMDEGMARQASDPELLQAAALIALAGDAPQRAVEILDGLPSAVADGPQRDLVQRARRERALAGARAALLAQDMGRTRAWLDEAEQVIDQRAVVLASRDGGSAMASSNPAGAEPWPDLAIARMRLATQQGRAARDRLGLLPPLALASQVQALLEWARLNADAGQAETALDGLQQALAAEPASVGWTPPERAEVLLAHGRLALDLDLPGTARIDADQIDALLPDDAIEPRLSLLRLQRRMGNDAAARDTLGRLLTQAPTEPLVRIEAARQARLDDDEASALRHLDVARRRVLPGSETALEVERVQDAIEADNQPIVDMALHSGSNAGSAGRSDLDSREATARLTWPMIGRGEFFAQVDQIALDAGTLGAAAGSSTLLGRTLLSSPGGLANGSPQSSQGLALGLGWRGGKQEVDLGVVDLRVRNWLGGWRLSGGDDALGWRIGIDRRLVTGSLLAWGGARDPVDGHVWGGVTLTALSARITSTLGDVHTLSGSWRAGLLRGQGVADNWTVQTGFSYRRVLRESMTQRQTLGATVDIQTYGNNQNFHTDGHGGYYSPQLYHAVSMPWVHEGMSGRLAWQLRLAVSHSVTHENDAPYYPNDPQAQASSGNPLHIGGPGGGFGASARLVTEWRAAPSWAIGTALSLERSSDYAPNRASIYLRHWMGRVPPPLGWPPEMLEPYIRR